MTLEKELAKRIDTHKYQIISAALIRFEDNGIYNSPLLMGQYGDRTTDDMGEERAFKVADELYARSKAGESEYYDKVYEMCWRKIRNKFNDNKAYNLDNEELKEY